MSLSIRGVRLRGRVDVSRSFPADGPRVPAFCRVDPAQALGTNPKTSLRRHSQRVENGGATEAVAAWMGFGTSAPGSSTE
jgi:hypothetical protein